MGYYQRLIARDQDEASDIAEDDLKDHGLLATFDELLVPALTSAKREVLTAALSADDQRHMIDATGEIVEELVTISSNEGRNQGQQSGAAAIGEASAPAAERVRVMAVAARDDTDRMALAMLGAAIDPNVFELNAGSGVVLVSEALSRVQEQEPDIVCIVALPAGGGAQARLLYRRLRTRRPKLPILVG